MGRDVARVAAGDVAGADDADPQGLHGPEPTGSPACGRGPIAQRADAVPSAACVTTRSPSSCTPSAGCSADGPPGHAAPPSPRSATGRSSSPACRTSPADELARLLDDAGPRRRRRRTRASTGCGPIRGPSRSGCASSAARASSCPRCRRRTGAVGRVPSAASPRSSGGWPRRCAATGSTLGYHNHDFEFAPLDGTTAFDVLLAELPAEIELEVDVYWVSVGGGDPVAAIRAARRPGADAAHEGPRPGATIPRRPGGLGRPRLPGDRRRRSGGARATGTSRSWTSRATRSPTSRRRPRYLESLAG